MKKLSLKTRDCRDYSERTRSTDGKRVTCELEACAYVIEDSLQRGVNDFGNCVVYKKIVEEETKDVQFFAVDGRLDDPETIADFFKIYETHDAWEMADIIVYNGKYWKGTLEADSFVEDIPF